MLSHVDVEQAVPHTMLSPSARSAVPHTMLVAQRGAVRLDDAAGQLVVAPENRAAPRARPRVPVARVRVREELRELHGALGVQEAGALRQRVVAVVLRGVLDDGLHEVRREVRIRLKHQRRRPRHHRRRHAGAAQAQVRLRAPSAAARRAGSSGLSCRACCPATASDTMPVPGATRSGLAPKSTAVGPREL